MNEKPQLVISQNSSKQIAYCCSLCGRKFSLPEERNPKDAVAELLGEFKRHVQEDHPLLIDDSGFARRKET